MRTFDTTPLFRSTVGFERLVDILDGIGNARPDWPPYNIEKTGENAYCITMAVAGFSASEIELTQQGNTLLVSGQKAPEQDNRAWLHQGIASRSFKQTFNLADHVKVTSANLANGLLAVELVREVPEQLKPRKIAIGGPAATPLDHQIERAKAA